MASRRPDSLHRAQRSFQRALREDSSYALAWAGLADVRILYADYSPASDEAEDDSMRTAIPEAKAAARRALELDEDLAEAHASLAIISMYEQRERLSQGNGPAALRHLRRAVELSPSYAQAHHWLGESQLHLGRAAPALEHLRLAVELTPDNLSARGSLTTTLIANRKCKAALTEAQRLRRMYPEREAGAVLQGLALLHLKRWDEVRELARERRAQSDDPPGWTTVFPALADVEVGDTAAARNRIEELRAEDDNFGAAVVHAALGDVDAAFKTFKTPPNLRTNVTLRYLYPDLLSRFRSDPRYEALIEEINRYWGLNPDGSIPTVTDASAAAETT